MEPAIADFANDVWRRAKGISLEEDNSAAKFSGKKMKRDFYLARQELFCGKLLLPNVYGNYPPPWPSDAYLA